MGETPFIMFARRCLQLHSAFLLVRRVGWGRGHAAMLRVGCMFSRALEKHPGLCQGCQELDLWTSVLGAQQGISPVPAGTCPCSAGAVATQRYCPTTVGFNPALWPL